MITSLCILDTSYIFLLLFEVNPYYNSNLEKIKVESSVPIDYYNLDEFFRTQQGRKNNNQGAK